MDADSLLLVGVSSFATYLIYKRYEPAGPLPAVLLLIALPGALVAYLSPKFPNISSVLLTTYPLYWLSVLVFVVTYRVSPFHPLASIPGPLPCKISKLWISRKVTGKKLHLYIQSLHKQYGPVVRIGPNELSFCDGEAVIPILGQKGLPKGPYYETRRHKEGTQMDGLRKPSEHAVRRRPWARATNSSALKAHHALLKDRVSVLMDSLVKQPPSRVALNSWMTFFGFDFLGHLAFSVDLGYLREGRDSRGLFGVLHQAIMDVAVISHSPWSYDFLRHIPGSEKPLKFLQALGADMVHKRIHSGFKGRDLFHFLIDEDGLESVKPNLGNVTSDGLLAIIAGSDTAATALSHTFYFLLQNPRYYERLQQEVDETFPRGEDSMDFTRQADMPYLNACINESLRLFPPVISGLQRRVEPGTGGRMIGPAFVPEGTQVSVHQYSLHRDPRYFSPLPEVYWPDRWLTQETYDLPTGDVIPATQLVLDKASFIPFSIGPQNCAGKAVAQLEMRAVLCALLQRFDLKRAEGARLEDWEDGIEDCYVTRCSGSLIVNLQPR